MTDPSDLPDLPHVVQIGRRLWETTPTGRATVMVGSGFSRNAEPKTTGAPPFPVWLDLAERLHADLHPGEAPGPDRDRRVERAAANGGLLQLALEYDAAFGRDRLDQLLIDAVPDDDHDPGELHRLLLTLPWADLLTTNYDTLLERTRNAVHHRRYSLVHVPQDLPGAPRPRIVKLHGSFRSHRPFVFTEEDFRRYPHRSRPFVNTVRQALMETALVLVGFSGDDPNFLSWAGWVRDELASSRPPVYLCGVLDLTPAQERVLSKRGVTPVDLGPLVPNRADPARHKKALRWLLLTLLKARPPGGVAWPLPEKGPTFSDDPDLPAFASGPHLVKEPVPQRAIVSGSTEPDLDPTGVAEAWAANRALDPGWAVLPLYNRRTLRRTTDRWIGIPSVAALADAASGLDRLRVVYEWAWRTARALDPLASAAGWGGGGAAIVEQTVESLDPTTLSGADLDRWTFLVLALVRHHRRHATDDGFERWAEAARAATSLRHEWAAELCYETAQRALGRLDVEGATAQLAAWPSGLLDPLWEIRRAAVLAETGEVKAAFALASETIARVRTEGEVTSRFAARSREGLAMFLADLTEPMTKEYFEIRGADTRWDELNGVRCNPRAEFEQLSQALEGDPPGLAPKRTVDVDALGNERVTYHDERTLTTGALRPASDLLGLFEAGLPLWSGLRVPSVVRAAHWVADPWPHWAVATLVRTLDHKALADALDRGRVAALNDGYADDVVAHALGVLGRAPGRLDQRGGDLYETPERHEGEVKTAMVILGRFAFRLSDEQRRQAIHHALRSVRSIWSERGHVATRREFQDLFRSLFDAVPDDEWAELLPGLLAMPLSGGPHEAVDPLRFVNARVFRGERPENAAIAIAAAVAAVEAGGEEKTAGLLRLLRLVEADILTDDEQRRLAEVIWRTTDEATGLPELRLFYPWVILFFPEPEPGASVAALRHALTEWVPPPRSGARTFGTSGAEMHFQSWASSTAEWPPPTTPSRAKTVEWTADEALVLIDQVEAWWRGIKRSDLRDGFLSGPTRSAGESAADALRAVALPLPLGDGPGRRAVRLLWKMWEADLPVRFALPATLLGTGGDARRVETAVRRGFASTESEHVADAAQAVFRWATLPDGPALPDGLADELVATATRDDPGAEEALGWLAGWVRRAPDSFPRRLVDTIAVGLQLILDTTAVPTVEERLRARSVPARRSLLRRPDLRAAGARLARALEETYRGDLDSETAAVLKRWRSETRSDPFPTVRRAWAEPPSESEA